MLSLETLESQVSAVMDTVVEAAVTELRTLLDQCWDKAHALAAHQRSAPATVKMTLTSLENEEGESEVTSPLDKQQFDKTMTKQFASLMAAWTRGAVEKIVMMLKVSMCEAEVGPPSAQRAVLNNEKKQTRMKPKAGRVAGSKKQLRSSKERKGGVQPALIQQNDHVSNTVNAATEECSSGSPSDTEAVLTEPTSELTSSERERDVVHDDTKPSTNTSRNTKKTRGPFKCPSCDKSFTLKCLMDRHYLTHSKPHLCSECGKRFSGLHGLNAHLRRHTGEKLYKCSECETEFSHKSTFVRHMRRHSLKKPNTHMCTLCESQFSGMLALQRHRCCALKKTFVCSLCPEIFQCRQSLADHENLHSGDRDFVCEMCGDSFFSYSSLATHRVTHMQKENCCDVLGLGCSDLSVLKNHLSKHTGEKLFTCEVCGKGCSHRSALKHHMLTHTGERPYVCETCGKRCGHASALINHMRIHTGRKPGQQPVCDVCGKKFRCMVNLKYHMSVHTGEKPYACDQCGKKFSNPSNLKLHLTIHSGEKMYGCNVCGRRFTQASSLKLHRRIHTGEKPYSCEVCRKGFRNSSDFRRHQRGHLPEEPGGGQSEGNARKI